MKKKPKSKRRSPARLKLIHSPADVAAARLAFEQAAARLKEAARAGVADDVKTAATALGRALKVYRAMC